MKSIVRWAVDNTPAINVALIALLAAGTWCMASMQREFWPYFVLDEIEIRVAYPGASPEDIEEAICEKIESAVASIYGIDEINALGAYVTDMRPEDSTGAATQAGFGAYIFLKTDPTVAEPETWALYIDEFGEIQVERSSN